MIGCKILRLFNVLWLKAKGKANRTSGSHPLAMPTNKCGHGISFCLPLETKKVLYNVKEIDLKMSIQTFCNES